MQNCDDRDEKQEELFKRLNATEELLGMPKARTDVTEEERRRRINAEIEYEQTFLPEHGLAVASIVIVVLLLLIWLSSRVDISSLYAP